MGHFRTAIQIPHVQCHNHLYKAISAWLLQRHLWRLQSAQGKRSFLRENYTLLLEVIFVRKQAWEGSTDTNSTCHARVQLSKDDEEFLWTVKIVKWLPEAWFADIDQGQIYVFEVGTKKHFSFIAVMQIRSTVKGLTWSQAMGKRICQNNPKL